MEALSYKVTIVKMILKAVSEKFNFCGRKKRLLKIEKPFLFRNYRL